MGKQRRQRRTNKKKGNNNKNKKNTTADLSASSSSSLVHRLRHANAPIRHATLTGLLHTTFAPNNNNNIPPSDLLHAVRDQVLQSASLSCSALAASCLARVVVAQQQQSRADTTTAGWYLLAVRRLQDVWSMMTSRSSRTNNNASAAAAELELMEQCAFLMVQLLETNPLVVERLDLDAFHALVVDTVLTTTTPTTTPTNSTRFHAWMARCLHAVWDDNPTAVAAAGRAVVERVVQRVATTTMTTTPPDLCTLHLVGAALAAYTCGDPHTLLATGIPDTCLPVVLAALSQPQQLLPDPTRLLTTYAAYRSQHDDAELEASIVAHQAVQQESARSIAKRHNAMAQTAAAAAAATTNMDDTTTTDETATAAATRMDDDDDDDDDTPMVDDDNDTTNNNNNNNNSNSKPSSGTLPEDRTDNERLWQEARDTLDDTVLAPLHVALEILVTFTVPCSSLSSSSSVATTTTTTTIGAHLLQVYHAIATWGAATEPEQQQQQPYSLRTIPALAERMGAVQAKAAMGIGHCWMTTPTTTVEAWQALRCAYSWNDAARESTIAALGVALRAQPALLLHGMAANHDTIIAALVDELVSWSNAPDVQRELIGVLGLLLRVLPPAQNDATSPSAGVVVMNRAVQHQSVVAAWMSVVVQSKDDDDNDTTPAMLLTEVLNGLMDVYGPDDCYPDVFAALQVLDFCRHCVPRLQRRIQVETEQDQDNHLDPEEVNGWHETLENTLRFIEYKENLLK